ncbi:hypothetical protein Xbed_03691 [Xenorhabdus beddingii]|uniref:Uncharacterized protein n=1 Tax=Xenorhabdus beddingii TaxID=40578 RepID=A0A1Y2S9Z0_9GAMM|nr:hypothetical protein Xbed_03691 [Xenorhabdus beddingii]
MAAEFKEVIMATDPIQSQQILPNPGERRFRLTERGFIAARDQRERIRGRQRLPVEFAVGGQRESLQRDKGTGQHVLRQMPGELPAQVGGNQFNSLLRAQIGHQPLLIRRFFAGNRFTGQHHRLAHPGAAHELSLDFTRLDAEAAQLDLKVVAAKVFEIAVGQPAAEVAGPVHAGSGIRAERIGQKTFGGQFRAVQVATGHPGSGDVHFTGHAKGNRLAVRVKDIDPQIGQGLTNQAAASGVDIGRRQLAIGGMDSNFGDAIHIHQTGLPERIAGNPRCQRMQLQRFPAEDNPAQ